MIASRTRSNDCLSDLRLDQLVAAELAAADEAVARRHLDACSACATRQHALADDRAAFRASLPARTFVADAIAARAPRPTRRAWWRLAMPAPLIWIWIALAPIAAAFVTGWRIRPPKLAAFSERARE